MGDVTDLETLTKAVVEALCEVERLTQEEREASRAESAARNRLADARNRLAASRSALDARLDKVAPR